MAEEQAPQAARERRSKRLLTPSEKYEIWLQQSGEHHRMLCNGYCIRPKAMDCQFENICESCTFFQTTIEFRPTCWPNATTPAPKAKPDARPSTTTSSPASTAPRPLDTDHPHNAHERAVLRTLDAACVATGGPSRATTSCSSHT